MSKIWNRHSSTKQSFGGGVPVWITAPKRKIVGARVLNPLKDMEKISAATPLEYDNAVHQAKFLKCWEVVSQAGAVITLKATNRTPEIYAGVNVMLAPETLTGTGLSAIVLGVVENAIAHTVAVTVSDPLLVAVAGDFLVEAAEAGADSAMFAIPNELSIDDTVGGDVTFVGIAQGNKYLYENTIPAMPAIVKAAIKDVEWERFNEVNS